MIAGAERDDLGARSRASIVARPVTAEHLVGLDALFSACANGCHCRYWHFGGDKNEWQARLAFDEDANRAEQHAAVTEQRADGLGVVALDGAEVVGWMKVTPRTAVPKLYDQRYYRGLAILGGDTNPQGVFSIGCVLVRPDRRRLGVATILARAAVDFARSRGATAIEAFPRVVSATVSDEELQAGPIAAFAEAGFAVVWDHAQYPVLRRTFESGRLRPKTSHFRLRFAS